ncbi:MAG: RHS repeat-associated core domain-containing protein [bacterium]|nr:RHS repeat-associated core domain-containing protein [bacterium]
MRTRYYSPNLGMFLSRDPVLGMVGGASIHFNAYNDAGANPVNFSASHLANARI